MDLGSGSDGDDSRPPRIFEIVRESPPNGGPETGVNMVSSSVCVDILNFRGLSKNQVEIRNKGKNGLPGYFYLILLFHLCILIFLGVQYAKEYSIASLYRRALYPLYPVTV